MPQITIIGTGLIGTSLALALKQSSLQKAELVGSDLEPSARAGAKKRGAFDRIETQFTRAVRDADMVVLATPVMAMKELMEFIGPELPEGCVVTDVGSSKKIVMEWASQYLPRTVDFVGGHPMCGKEESGPEAAEATLFQDKSYCVIPSPSTRQQAVSKVTNMVEAIGARPYYIDVEEHDTFAAAASHLPFLLSVALVGCTSKSPNWDTIAKLASTGYRDISRLASGDPVMHRDICLTNTESIVAWIDAAIRELYEIRKVLDSGATSDGEAVQRIFEQALDARALWLAEEVESPAHRRSRHDVPSMGEAMGEMFLGRRAIEAQKRLLGDSDKDRKKK